MVVVKHLFRYIIMLRKGNHGFRAFIVKDNEIIAWAHDLEEAEGDSTYAEFNAIRKHQWLTKGIFNKYFSTKLAVCANKKVII